MIFMPRFVLSWSAVGVAAPNGDRITTGYVYVPVEAADAQAALTRFGDLLGMMLADRGRVKTPDSVEVHHYQDKFGREHAVRDRAGTRPTAWALIQDDVTAREPRQTTGLSLEQALAAMRSGAKVRRFSKKNVAHITYMILDGQLMYFMEPATAPMPSSAIDSEGVMLNDWEIVP